MIYGKVIIYRTGAIIIFIDNLKFKLEKAKNINSQTIFNISYKHNLILNIGSYVQFFDLIPFLFK